VNAAIREGMITDNPARRVEMPAGRWPQAVVWTEGRVEDWHADGVCPGVAVWAPSQLTEFLEMVAEDPLYPLWWLIALRGLHRGDAAGLRWHDIDLDNRQLTITNQRTTVGYQIIEGPPKSAASRRTIALDRRTVTVLRAHLRRQRAQHLITGRAWRASGYVFTRTDAGPSTRTTPRNAFASSAICAAYPRSGCTTYATAPPVSPTPPAPTSRPCRTNSGTPASCSPPTPTPASCPLPSHRPAHPHRPQRPLPDDRQERAPPSWAATTAGRMSTTPPGASTPTAGKTAGQSRGAEVTAYELFDHGAGL
jgi:hypothetical protein